MNRSTWILGLAALVLAALVLVVIRPFEDSVRRDNPRKTKLVAIEDPASIDGIEITAPGKQFVLARSTSGWSVANRDDFPADTAAVGSVLKAVANLSVGSVASHNPAKQGTLGVDSLGVDVAVKASGRELAHFVVGKSDPGDFTSSFVRPADSDDVYRVRGVNRNLFNRAQGFRDRTLASFNPEDVASVELAAADTGWVVTRADSVWAVSSPDGTEGEATEAQVKAITRILSTLSADGFQDEAIDGATAGLDEPEMTFTVRTLSGREWVVRIGAKNARGQHYASRPDRKAIYLINDWRLRSLRKRASDFLKT